MPNKLKEVFKGTLSHLPFANELEDKLEEGIEKALGLLKIPSRQEVQSLNQRLDQLLDRCDLLLQEQGQPAVSATSVSESESNVKED